MAERGLGRGGIRHSFVLCRYSDPILTKKQAQPRKETPEQRRMKRSRINKMSHSRNEQGDNQDQSKICRRSSHPEARLSEARARVLWIPESFFMLQDRRVPGPKRMASAVQWKQRVAVRSSVIGTRPSGSLVSKLWGGGGYLCTFFCRPDRGPEGCFGVRSASRDDTTAWR